MRNYAASVTKIYLPELSQLEIVGQSVREVAKVISLPLYLDRISAGFPSPADDYIEAELDLNRYMIRNPPDTFMVRVTNDALSGIGILDRDILIVDRSIRT